MSATFVLSSNDCTRAASMRQSAGSTTRIRKSRPTRRWMAFVLVGLLSLVGQGRSMKATWTPNEDDGGPLPLSNNQRQQLLQLEQAIVSAPDPQATLQQAAAANDMSPQELADLLNRNHADMEAAGAIPSGGGGGPRSSNRLKFLASLGASGLEWAKRHPKAFLTAATATSAGLYVAVAAPRTGLVLSNRASLFSKGPTRFWKPPAGHVRDHFLTSALFKSPATKQKNLVATVDMELTNGPVWHKLARKSTLQQLATAQVTLDMVEMVPDDIETEAVTQVVLEQASNMLESLQLTEFTNHKSIQLIAAARKHRRPAALVVRNMGDYGGYGLLPLQVTHQEENDEGVSLTLSTLPGGHWDGQIHVSITNSPDHDGMKIQVYLMVPKKGRKVSRKKALEIVDALSQSIARSLRTKSSQVLARRSQSSRFKGSASNRAVERRHSRHTKEEAIEAMSADRRRRWQRENPNAGSYRPSGDRMKSPHNAVY